MFTRMRRRLMPVLLGSVLVAGGLAAAPASAAPQHAAPAAHIAACPAPSAEFADWWTDKGWPRTGTNKQYETQDPDGGGTVWITGGETYRNDSDPHLPDGTYNSYDAVFVKDPDQNRGTRRLVREADSHETYYTDDHYESFCDMGTV